MSKTIYIDSEFRCYTTNDGSRTAVETDVFDDRCDSYIEGYRFVPAGQSWTRSDGVVFQGEMIAPLKDYKILSAYQEQYETMQSELEDMREALSIMGVST